MSMRRKAVIAFISAIVIGGAAWAFWPTTKWPRSFCAPVVRAVSADADAISISLSHPAPTLTITQQNQVATLLHDVRLADVNAPTAQLQLELNRYLAQLGVTFSTQSVTDAMSRFDQQARTQLRDCGVNPIGS